MKATEPLQQEKQDNDTAAQGQQTVLCLVRDGYLEQVEERTYNNGRRVLQETIFHFADDTTVGHHVLNAHNAAEDKYDGL